VNYQEGIHIAESILEDIPSIPEEGEEFAESVEEKVQSMREWMEEKEWVTPAMAAALRNMREGVDKWLRPRRT